MAYAIRGPFAGRRPSGPLEATLELAQTQLLAQIADETSLDGRTVGILAFLGALLAVDVAAKDTDLGPLSVTFYATYGGHPQLQHESSFSQISPMPSRTTPRA